MCGKEPNLRHFVTTAICSRAALQKSRASEAARRWRTMRSHWPTKPKKRCPVARRRWSSKVARLLRSENIPDAFVALLEAKKRDEHALDDPQALLALGRAAARTAHTEEARRAYEMLLPRASALAPSDRGIAYDEAGMVALDAGPAALDEAIATFRQAERDAQDLPQTVAVLGLALSLDRGGEHAEAKAVLDERIHGDPRPLLKNAVAAGVIGPGTGDNEMEALAAIGLEGSDPAAAREAWKRYAEHAPAAWADHARSRIAGKISTSRDPKKPKAKTPATTRSKP